MKKLFIYSLLLLLSASVSVSVSAHIGRPIEQRELPAPARQFIEKYFPNTVLTLARVEGVSIMHREYEVVLSDATRIEFRGNGEWQQVDSREPLPQGIVPRQIESYVAERFQHERIVGIERDRRSYEVALDSGVELRFDSSFRLTEIDD